MQQAMFIFPGHPPSGRSPGKERIGHAAFARLKRIDRAIGRAGLHEARHFKPGRGDIKRFQARPAKCRFGPIGSLLPPSGLLRLTLVILQGGNGCGRSSACSL